MSTNKSPELLTFGIRLTQERKRLGYSQTTLAAKLDRSKATQVKYESGDTHPDADYFLALHKLGADIHYIITGELLEALKAEDERQLLKNYRAFNDRDKSLMLNLFNDIVRSDAASKKGMDTKTGAKQKNTR
jgi:transcriptional regulator with XRE-family HTH domain